MMSRVHVACQPDSAIMYMQMCKDVTQAHLAAQSEESHAR